ncbi:MAG: hypothetical protein RL698_1356 [Pseudomonadota bacterium]|jgi:sterol desaturase/sphingolipid hydroxylase (fatty acid hydroxylase superfamily)
MSTIRFIEGLAGGLAGWTLLEYAIHFWLGHLPRGRILTSREHLAHHADILYFTPLRLKIRGAIPVLSLVMLGVAGAWGATTGVGATVGVAIGWTAYETLHKSIHVSGPRSAWSRWASRNHLDHHFRHPRANHGVTTPIWDFVFRTHVKVERVRVPARAVEALPWLARAVDEEPRADFLSDYEIAT